jgi:predicted nucleic acid-binding protein
MIVDANVILRAFFPDEVQEKAQALLRDHVVGGLQLKAPSLLPYELSNAIWQAERRQRISSQQADEIIAAVEGLQIEILLLDMGEMLPMARQFDRSAYDAAYLTLANKLDEQLITGDERLWKAVHSHLDWVVWIEEYGEGESKD